MAKRTFFGLLCLFIATSVAAQEGGMIRLYGDPAGTDCNVMDNTVGLREIYVVHTAPNGATSAHFAVPKPDCFTATMLSTSGNCGIAGCGDPNTSLVIPYGQCLSGNIHILTLNFFANGLTEPCCLYSVIPAVDAQTGSVEATNCNDEVVEAFGAPGLINGTEACPCNLVIATEDRTWGSIKALYGE